MAFARVAYKGAERAVCRVVWIDLQGQRQERAAGCDCHGHAKPCAAAKHEAKVISAEIKQGRRGRQAAAPADVGDVIDRWLERKKVRSAATADRYATYARHWKRWLGEKLGITRFHMIGADELQQYVNGRLAELRGSGQRRAGAHDWSTGDVEARIGKTMHSETTALRGLFAFAIRGGYWVPAANQPPNYDPSREIERPQLSRRLPRPLSVAEQAKVLQAAYGNARWYAQICLALYAGLRREGVCRLRTRDVDLERGVLRVTEKGAKERDVEIVPALAAALRRCPPVEGSDYWFGNLTERDIEEFSASLCQFLRDVTGRKNVVFHQLRHSFATNFLTANPDQLAGLQDLLGHASPATTRIYGQVVSSTRRAAMARLPVAWTPPPETTSAPTPAPAGTAAPVADKPAGPT